MNICVLTRSSSSGRGASRGWVGSRMETEPSRSRRRVRRAIGMTVDENDLFDEKGKKMREGLEFEVSQTETDVHTDEYFDPP